MFSEINKKKITRKSVFQEKKNNILDCYEFRTRLV